MSKRQERTKWVSYLRVSSPEQAERELSLPAQRHALNAYAERSGHAIDKEYVEAGCSGTNMNRKAFRQMLEDVLSPGSEIEVVLVHHTSRFTRNATQAGVVKEKLRKEGVRVVSVCQETHDDPIGQLIEGIFECIDQYESEINGMRTVAAMREAVRQGFFPGSAPPYGFRITKVEIRTGVLRSVLVPDEDEAEIVRELFRLYVANNGAKAVARSLNQRGLFYRRKRLWSKDKVLKVLDEPALAGTYYWGKRDAKTRRLKDRSEWLSLEVEAIVEPSLYELARKLRAARAPVRNPGRPASPENVLSGLVRCGKCGAAYTLESSGKHAGNGRYQYRYYNCRRSCRIGKEACAGGRIPTKKLDAAVLGYLSEMVTTQDRCDVLLGDIHRGVFQDQQRRRVVQLEEALVDIRERIGSWKMAAASDVRHQVSGSERLTELQRYERELHELLQGVRLAEVEIVPTGKDTIDRMREAWSVLITSGGTAGRNYLHQLVERIEVDENRILVVAKENVVEMAQI